MGFRRSEVRILSPRHRKARRDLKFWRAFLRYLTSGWVPYPPHTRLETVGGYGAPSPVGLSWDTCCPLEGLNMSARPSPRKPWLHAPSGFWCAQIAGKRHYLDRDPGIAQRKLLKLLQEQKRGDAAQRHWLDGFFAD